VPGRTPAEAVRAFLEPLQEALACIATGTMNIPKGGHSPRVGDAHQWIINNGLGAELLSEGGDLQLFASMHWMLIKDDRDGYGPYRVKTLGYDYSLVQGESTELWALHWHPAGRSWERRPHLHVGDAVLAAGAPVSSKSHLGTGRMTFENAIRWAIEFGAMPLHDNWADRLALAETPHMLFRTWSGDPGVARP
jgi:hypothetical protein